MSLTKYKRFENLLKQEGNFLYVRDKSVWPVESYAETEVVSCAVWYHTNDSLIIYKDFYDETTRFLIDMATDYDIFVYLVPKFTISALAGEIRWHGDKVWKCLLDTSEEPLNNSSYWQEIDELNIDELNALGEPLTAHYHYNGSFTTIEGELAVTKTADHSFTVKWLGEETVVSAILRNYKMEKIVELYPIDNIITVTPEDDGVYIVEFTLNTESVHYAEVYDFTDSEKCFLNLMVSVFCECTSCDDCPGSAYDRALNFINTYIMLRNIINADRSVDVGLVSSQVLRTDYTSMLGLLLDKLSIMVSECTCDNN